MRTGSLPMNDFEELIRHDLQQYLLSEGEIDERLPECPDVEGKWEAIACLYPGLVHCTLVQ